MYTLTIDDDFVSVNSPKGKLLIKYVIFNNEAQKVWSSRRFLMHVPSSDIWQIEDAIEEEFNVLVK
jgi:hypothetical protein